MRRKLSEPNDPWRSDPQEKAIRDVLDHVWLAQAAVDDYNADRGSEDFKDRAGQLLNELESLTRETLRNFHPHGTT